MLKRHLMETALFLGGLFLILQAAALPLRPKNKSVYNSVIAEEKAGDVAAMPENTIDVLICGDSESYSAFSPLQMWGEHGITAYDTGSPGQRLCDTEAILAENLKNQKPKLVIIEANTLYRYAGADSGPDNFVVRMSQAVIPILRYHNRWKIIASGESSCMLEDSHSLLYRGFVVRKSAIPWHGKNYMKQTSGTEEFPDQVTEYLAKIQKLCSDNGAKLLLVSVPSPKNWSYKKHNTVAAWAEENGVDYQDLNLCTDQIGIQWSKDTLDAGDHLNFAGATKVTDYYSRYLLEKYHLADHRNDAAYAVWQSDFEKAGLYPAGQ